VVAAALWSGRIASPARTLALALAVVTALDPWAVLQPGFWLSFGAVALIFYVSAGRTEIESRLRQWLRMQWAITVGLAPAALFLFAQVSVAGPLANALAIPLVSAVITPLALAAARFPRTRCFSRPSGWCRRCCSTWNGARGCRARSGSSMCRRSGRRSLALAGVAWLLAPRGVPWRASGLALMLPAVALPPPSPAAGEAWITTFDVGQGLAVLVRTARHALLYDAGPAFGPDADSGERIVAPALRALGVRRLDALVLTHDDTDHTGGARSVLERLEVDALLHSLPASPSAARAGAASAPLRARQPLGMGRRALRGPASGAGRQPQRRNDASCVLRVAAGERAMLLAGDIERGAEAELAARGGLRADALLMPHHGSRSSSSAAFLEAVRPRLAVAAAGYRNRFGHPAADVLARYAAVGARVLRTDRDGAVTLRLAPDGLRIETQRARRARYWHVPAPPA
jgi:competence protein ComEC